MNPVFDRKSDNYYDSYQRCSSLFRSREVAAVQGTSVTRNLAELLSELELKDGSNKVPEMYTIEFLIVCECEIDLLRPMLLLGRLQQSLLEKILIKTILDSSSIKISLGHTFKSQLGRGTFNQHCQNRDETTNSKHLKL